MAGMGSPRREGIPCPQEGGRPAGIPPRAYTAGFIAVMYARSRPPHHLEFVGMLLMIFARSVPLFLLLWRS